MPETTLATLPAAGSFAAAVTNMNAANLAAINQIVTDQNANNASLRASINAAITAPNPVPSAYIDPQVIQYATVTIDNTHTKGLYSAPTTLVAAQGAGTLIEILSLLLEYKYSTAKMTAGDTIQASYDTGVTIPASATIAASFLTGPAANEVILVAGALGDNLASAVVNKKVILTCATQDFATGSGTLIAKVSYRVHSGL